ncbi:uncharacterized protein B0H18DRAFT_474144 [Fomitopsis serialis]|uniref:uncharacterized protein n=1 Tax=Fomitopsis serialis TaxID=139415 RepID=UPI002008B9A5|nr:uncharacterized protein B0H18DRAFT_474144 [Neoantrodia serialis]KAH9923251.1 hypothetical protein B0H18DRAFT_474144 [Neoantrodia serialis]
MSRIELPIEIQEQVLDHLHDDPLTLRACSLTCLAWVPTTRLHSFRLVRLRGKRHCLRFLRVIESTSTPEAYGHHDVGVGVLVRELHLSTMGLRQVGVKEGLRFDLLRQILRHLPNVELLGMQSFDLFSCAKLLTPEARDTGIELRDTIASIFPFPRLTI